MKLSKKAKRDSILKLYVGLNQVAKDIYFKVESTHDENVYYSTRLIINQIQDKLNSDLSKLNKRGAK